MPRKPSSFFLITQVPSSPGLAPGQPAQFTTQRIPLTGDETAHDVAPRYYHGQPAGTVFYMVDDTKVDAHTVTLHLEPVDDPRLPDPEEPPAS